MATKVQIILNFRSSRLRAKILSLKTFSLLLRRENYDRGDVLSDEAQGKFIFNFSSCFLVSFEKWRSKDQRIISVANPRQFLF